MRGCPPSNDCGPSTTPTSGGSSRPTSRSLGFAASSSGGRTLGKGTAGSDNVSGLQHGPLHEAPEATIGEPERWHRSLGRVMPDGERQRDALALSDGRRSARRALVSGNPHGRAATSLGRPHHGAGDCVRSSSLVTRRRLGRRFRRAPARVCRRWFSFRHRRSFRLSSLIHQPAVELCGRLELMAARHCPHAPARRSSALRTPMTLTVPGRGALRVMDCSLRRRSGSHPPRLPCRCTDWSAA
jgi:hypothetical protein